MPFADGAVFPVGKPRLSLREIADYWSREMRPLASRNELLGLLEGAWWLGEIRGDSAARLELLKRMFQSMRDRNDLGIVFITGEDEGKSSIEELSDGTVVVDVRHRVPLPSSDTNTWDEVNCKDAFLALAQTSSVGSYPEITPALAFIELSYDEFTGWRERRGYTKPKFWKPQSASTPLKKAKRGRPADYNWEGVGAKLLSYVSQHGPVATGEELLQKCADFATDLHPKKRTPAEKTIREAIKTHALDSAAGRSSGEIEAPHFPALRIFPDRHFRYRSRDRPQTRRRGRRDHPGSPRRDKDGYSAGIHRR
jgi:hypothetical protein